MKIRLELTLDQVNRIVAALGDKPLKDVVDLWLVIKQQAESQVAKQQRRSRANIPSTTNLG